jgi:hypothetical protein
VPSTAEEGAPKGTTTQRQKSCAHIEGPSTGAQSDATWKASQSQESRIRDKESFLIEHYTKGSKAVLAPQAPQQKTPKDAGAKTLAVGSHITVI